MVKNLEPIRIILIHNYYKIRGGECVAVDLVFKMLQRRGAIVYLMTRNSQEIGGSIKEKLTVFATSIFSLSAKRDMTQIINEIRPNIVHVHNLYPLISPSVLESCRRAGLPVVMTSHNYRFTCPIGTHFRKGQICELCVNSSEFWCLLTNCRGNYFESGAYFLRSAIARKLQLFHNNITIFIALTRFSKNRLIKYGFSEDRVHLLPNLVSVPFSLSEHSEGKYVAYVGRISEEKGLDTLLAAATITGLPVHIAGDYSQMNDLVKSAPTNVKFVGILNKHHIDIFYQGARYLVVPSKCFEGHPLVLSEAMSNGLSVIASRIGGLSEIIENGVNGLLFEPGDSEELADKMKLLWENSELCRKMGQEGRIKAMSEYTEEVYYKNLINIYEKAIEINNKIRKQD